MWLVSGRNRDERGAVAVVFGICAVALFSVAAMGVDLGNGMNRRQENQNSADFAALAGAALLPAKTSDQQTAARQKVADYLNQNRPSSDGDTCNNSGATITAAQLADGDTANGEVTFLPSNKMKVVATSTKVNFGMANVMGFSDVCVQGSATVTVKSRAIGFAPYYATAACASGPQVLKSDAGGPSIPFTVPPLFKDGESNTSVLSATDPNPYPNSVPVAAAADPDGPLLTLTGTNLDATRIDKVGFFNTDQSAPAVADPVSQSPTAPGTSISVNLPHAVGIVADVWWIRVHDKVTDTWSARAEARPLQIGDAVLSCDPESSSGNFGAIDIPWTNNNNTNIETAIRLGNPPPMSLTTWQGRPLPAMDTCQNDTVEPGVISTLGSLKPSTNCISTSTGLRAGPAYDGYLKNNAGKLRVDTSDLCESQGRPARQTLSTGETVNADLMTCFLRNDTLRLSDVINYTGGPSPFVSEIWDSPRFTLVPVLSTDPNGSAKYQPIVTFVGGFICDEVTGASRPNPLETGQTENGFVMQHPNKLRAIRIIFFPYAALPPRPDGTSLIDYLGVGTPIPTMVN